MIACAGGEGSVWGGVASQLLPERGGSEAGVPLPPHQGRSRGVHEGGEEIYGASSIDGCTRVMGVFNYYAPTFDGDVQRDI
mgnify:CR=1 FL=1